MVKIGLLSDTHGFISKDILEFFSGCDEIWHAGDIGTLDVIQLLQSVAPVKAVYGNIDGHEIRSICSEWLRFTCEELQVLMIHIGGYPGNYDRAIKARIQENPPDLFISGHSHILKVINDKRLHLLHMNPGAAGKSGFHKVRTAMRFFVDKKKIRNLEIFELKR